MIKPLKERLTPEEAEAEGYRLVGGPYEDSEEAIETASEIDAETPGGTVVTYASDDEGNYFIYMTEAEHVDRTGPTAGEVIELEADGSIDREEAIKLLVKRGYRRDAAAKMVDEYNTADEVRTGDLSEAAHDIWGQLATRKPASWEEVANTAQHPSFRRMKRLIAREVADIIEQMPAREGEIMAKGALGYGALSSRAIVHSGEPTEDFDDIDMEVDAVDVPTKGLGFSPDLGREIGMSGYFLYDSQGYDYPRYIIALPEDLTKEVDERIAARAFADDVLVDETLGERMSLSEALKIALG